MTLVLGLARPRMAFEQTVAEGTLRSFLEPVHDSSRLVWLVRAEGRRQV